MKVRPYILFTCILIALLGTGSCKKDASPTDSGDKKNVNLFITTRSTADNNTVNSDNTIKSVALFIYHENLTVPEFVHFDTSPSTVPDVSIDWKKQTYLLPGNKTIYVLVNYKENTFDGGVVFSNTTTRAQLEALNVSATLPLNATALPMCGKFTGAVLNQAGVQQLTIPVNRLASRIDVYVYKNAGITEALTIPRSVQLYPVVSNSKVIYDVAAANNAMHPTPSLVTAVAGTYSAVPAGKETIANDHGTANYNILPVTEAKTSFYSFSYRPDITTSYAPLTIIVPFKKNTEALTRTVTVTLTSDGTNATTLLPNRCYRVVIVLNEYDYTVEYSVEPWVTKTVTIPSFE